MSATGKKMAAAFAAVSAYIRTEEEALVMSPPSKPSRRRFDNGNLWGISSRQDIMQTRSMMHFQTLKR